MRDKVASPVFRLEQRVEHALERVLPGTYVSRYELVSFSTTPYAEVQRRVRRSTRCSGRRPSASPRRARVAGGRPWSRAEGRRR